jgi:hypothetical protein
LKNRPDFRRFAGIRSPGRYVILSAGMKRNNFRTMLAVAMGCGALLLPGIARAAPGAPAGLNAASVKATSFTLKWSAATGATGGIARI